MNTAVWCDTYSCDEKQVEAGNSISSHLLATLMSAVLEAHKSYDSQLVRIQPVFTNLQDLVYWQNTKSETPRGGVGIQCEKAVRFCQSCANLKKG